MSKEDILDLITEIMRENELDIGQATKRFEDIHNGEYEQEDLDMAIAELNNVKEDLDNPSVDDKTPAAAAAWVVSDQEARKNYEINTRGIGPDTDEKIDPIEEMGRD